MGSSFRCAPGGCALAAAAFGIWLRPAAQSIGDPDRAQSYGSKLLLYLRACNSNLAWCYHFGTLNNLRHTAAAPPPTQQQQQQGLAQREGPEREWPQRTQLLSGINTRPGRANRAFLLLALLEPHRKPATCQGPAINGILGYLPASGELGRVDLEHCSRGQSVAQPHSNNACT